MTAISYAPGDVVFLTSEGCRSAKKSLSPRDRQLPLLVVRVEPRYVWVHVPGTGRDSIWDKQDPLKRLARLKPHWLEPTTLFSFAVDYYDIQLLKEANRLWLHDPDIPYVSMLDSLRLSIESSFELLEDDLTMIEYYRKCRELWRPAHSGPTCRLRVRLPEEQAKTLVHWCHRQRITFEVFLRSLLASAISIQHTFRDMTLLAPRLRLVTYPEKIHAALKDECRRLGCEPPWEPDASLDQGYEPKERPPVPGATPEQILAYRPLLPPGRTQR